MEQSSLVPDPRVVLAEVGHRPFGSFLEHTGSGSDPVAHPVPADDDLQAATPPMIPAGSRPGRPGPAGSGTDG